MTAVAYLYSGFFVSASIGLVPWILPSVLIGVPIGYVIARHRSREVILYRQGTMNLIVNAHPDALPEMVRQTLSGLKCRNSRVNAPH